jgi:hypothetical protein
MSSQRRQKKTDAHGGGAGAPLETVDLDVILLERVFAHLGLVLVGEKVHHFSAMVSLELDHLAHVLVLNDGAIASYTVSMEMRIGTGYPPYSFLKALRSALGL